ncbi:hypothetical protein ACIA5D_31815 [Actinoplanes sp. NPDC051513]|uniref:hypothetical protein n=1 Tax=Actinoplanes sp. NPDC051513 TaxID=3363908 RepID=UPI0037B21937
MANPIATGQQATANLPSHHLTAAASQAPGRSPRRDDCGEQRGRRRAGGAPGQLAPRDRTQAVVAAYQSGLIVPGGRS